MAEEKIETTAEFCTRLRKRMDVVYGGNLHLSVADARRLGFHVAEVPPRVESVIYVATSERVRAMLEAHEKGLAGQLADAPADPVERRRAMRTPEQAAEEARRDAEGVARAQILGLVPPAAALYGAACSAPPGTTLRERLLLAASEWEKGAAVRVTQPSRYDQAFSNAMGACAAVLRHAAERPEARALVRGAMERWERVRHHYGGQPPLDEADRAHADALDVAANRLRHLLNTAPLEPGEPVPESPLAPPKLEEGIGQSFAKVAAADTIASVDGRFPPSVLYDDSESFREEFPLGRFLTGELDDLICDTDVRLRDMTLAWSGVDAELRPAERELVGRQITAFRRYLTAAYHAAQALSEALEATRAGCAGFDDDEG